MLVVQKYGGSSLATPEHIQKAAERIASLRRTGTQVVVVASAMGHTTDELLELARKTVKHPPLREMDMLLTAGERISMSLLAMALEERGVSAISFTGSQSGIITTNEHTEAKILEIRPYRIQEELAKGKVVIIAGFQGVSEQKEITTLGRGGSDTTAVSLAAVLEADRCEILTDVEGLYTGDPRIIPEAKVIEKIDYPTAIQASRLGAKMQARSMELAQKAHVPVRIMKSFERGTKGTLVAEGKESPILESYQVKTVATLTGLDLLSAKIDLLSLSSIYTQHHTLLQYFSERGGEILFLCPAEKTERVQKNVKGDHVLVSVVPDVAIVSLVGTGFGISNRVLEQALELLKELEIRPLFMFVQENSYSWVVPKTQRDKLAKGFHKRFFG